MSSKRSIVLCSAILIGLVLPGPAGVKTAPAPVGTINVTSVQYPGSPETLTIGERVPIIVKIAYADLVNASEVSLHIAYTDYPPRFQAGQGAVLSGTGTYEFPVCEIMVPASYSIPSGWPKYINEWHLTAEIWKGKTKIAGRQFTVLVENPEYKPDVEIDKFDYVVPPDTIAVDEETSVKIHTIYSNLESGTKIEMVLRDSTGIIKSNVSRSLSGSGKLTFGMIVKPKTSGSWTIEAAANTVTGSLLVGDKKSIMIQVVR
jgi:hypothetical protein